MSGDAIRVVVVDDHDMVRQGLVAALAAEDDIDVVAEASLLTEGLAACERLVPDVAVCDHQLPDGRGSDLPHALANPSTAVLLVTGAEPASAVSAAVAGGCSGFVSKTAGIDALVRAVRDVASDRAVFPAGALAAIATSRQGSAPDLTPREMDVLRLLADAKDTEAIMHTLGVSLHTARNHIRSLLTKLDAKTRLEAVVTAARMGLVDVTGGPGREGAV